MNLFNPFHLIPTSNYCPCHHNLHQRTRVRMKRTHLSSSSIIKEQWDSCSLISLNNKDGDNYNSYLRGDASTTWPPKNYACSFCRREFKSAQALGGHMNVHRRDRARLRQLPSWVFESSYDHLKRNFNPNPNPNPNLSSSSQLSPSPSSSYSEKFSSPASFTKSSLKEKKPVNEFPRWRNLSSSKNGDASEVEVERHVHGDGEFKNTTSHAKRSELDGLKKGNQVISLDLEMGFKDPKHVLDLELRLGYFN